MRFRGGFAGIVLFTAATMAHAAAAAPQPRLVAAGIDAIDGRIVVRAWQETLAPDGTPERQPVTEPLTWTIESGRADVARDPYTGDTLFKPLGEATVVATPHLGPLAGEPVVVGMNPNTVPAMQRFFVQTGGGGCNVILLDSLRQLDVRSVVSATIIPLSRTERVLRYHHNAEYYAYDPKQGALRLRFNPNYTSQVRLRSLDPHGSPFFPASAETELYLEIELLDTGARWFNKKPLVMRKASTDWPPYQEPLLSSTTVQFYDERNPDIAVMTILNQEAYLYPSTELEVRRKSFTIEDGVVDVSFEVRNLTESPADIRWFFIGDLGKASTPTDGIVTAPGGGTFDVHLRTSASRATVQQSVTLGVVSQSGTRLSGFDRIEFRYPATPEVAPRARQ